MTETLAITGIEMFAVLGAAVGALASLTGAILQQASRPNDKGKTTITIKIGKHKITIRSDKLRADDITEMIKSADDSAAVEKDA